MMDTPENNHEEDTQSQSRPVGLAEEEMDALANLFTEDIENKEDTEVNTPMLDDHEQQENQSFDPLQKLASSDYKVETESTTRFLSENLGIDMAAGQTLEQRIKAFQRQQIESMSHYIESSVQRPWKNTNGLIVLNGWNHLHNAAHPNSSPLAQTLLPAHYRRTCGGFFLRWNGKGVVINPGTHFLQNFHDYGLHIKDIDYIIVTRDDPHYYSDIQAIYDLNYGLNKMSSDLHVIHYYLNQQAHRAIATTLKPHFKQERNTVHSLDLYVDSPDIESLTLSEGITLHYFPTTPQESSNSNSDNRLSQSQAESQVGIRLELQMTEMMQLGTEGASSVTVGYVSGAGYSPLLAHYLNGTDVLITGFENTGSDDYGKLKYNETSLGFFGTYSLMEEVSPKVLIFSEFSGHDGDIRLEVAKKLQQECAYRSSHNPVALPGDTGMVIDLEKLQVRCGITHTFMDLSQIRIVKTTDSYGSLQYLSPGSFI